MDPDGGGTTIECDVFAQDCPLGEKCMAWANDGASSWNATRCTEVDPNPAAIGDACTVVGSGVSGIDSCDIGVMCWDVDVETNTGTCVEMCSGSARNPVCNTPQTACSISNEGVLILCLPICNPLAGECGEGQGCYDTGDVFQCAPDASGGDTTTGDPCEFLNACSDGYACVNPAVVPDCVGSVGCCTAYCTIDDESPCVDGQTCIPYYEAGTAPDACLEDVGICSAG
jgi:hypothetical protein